MPLQSSYGIQSSQSRIYLGSYLDQNPALVLLEAVQVSCPIHIPLATNY
jgi:hypothetical protein